MTDLPRDVLAYQRRILDRMGMRWELEPEPEVDPPPRGDRLSSASCCDDPRPRISERTGRIFCASCRRFLDTSQDGPEPLRRTDPEKTGNRPPHQEGDSQ